MDRLDEQYLRLHNLEARVNYYKDDNAKHYGANMSLVGVKSEFETKRKKIYQEYENDVRRHINEYKDVKSDQDLRFEECIKTFKEDINNMGDKMIALIDEAYRYLANNSKFVTKLYLIDYVEFMLSCYRDVSDTIIENDAFNLKLSYKQDLSDDPGFNATKDMLNKFKHLKEYDEHLDEIKEAELLKRACAYHVLVEDLDKHEAYLKAKRKAEEAFTYQDYLEVIELFKVVDGYLDSHEYLDKYNAKAKYEYENNVLPRKIKEASIDIEKHQDELESLNLEKHHLINKINEIEIIIRQLEDAKALEGKSELDAYKAKIKAKEDEIAKVNANIQEAELSLKNASIFAYKLKKELKLKLDLAHSELTKLNEELEIINQAFDNLNNSINISKAEIDKKLVIREELNDYKGRLNLIKNRINNLENKIFEDKELISLKNTRQ